MFNCLEANQFVKSFVNHPWVWLPVVSVLKCEIDPGRAAWTLETGAVWLLIRAK